MLSEDEVGLLMVDKQKDVPGTALPQSVSHFSQRRL